MVACAFEGGSLANYLGTLYPCSTMRNYIVDAFAKNPTRRLAFRDISNDLNADSLLVLKMYRFLDRWGIINRFDVEGVGYDPGNLELATRAGMAARSPGRRAGGRLPPPPGAAPPRGPPPSGGWGGTSPGPSRGHPSWTPAGAPSAPASAGS